MARKQKGSKARNLGIILGDQLDSDSALFRRLEKDTDALWMAEVAEEATHVWSHKKRLAFFFAAMRHFRDAMRGRGWTVHYTELPRLPADDLAGSLGALLRVDADALGAERLLVVKPGDWRVEGQLREAAEALGLELEVLEDTHFFCPLERFEQFAANRKSLVLETFYRQMRKEHDVLLDSKGQPVGGAWNFDADNRETFGKEGPGTIPPLPAFEPDATTRAVVELVNERFADHPGSLDSFNLPVTREQALAYLDDFLARRLRDFGTYQDAMWTQERFLYHSRLSAVLNLKLLNPREAVAGALEQYRANNAPLNSVEGFVRQVLGWREFIRGVYWHEMPEYAELNALGQEEALPGFFWDGGTDMACARDAMANVLEHGYAHHIQRLMVLGLFAQIYGAHPHAFHEWHLAMYLDAVDWVSLPNALGMSQYGDGGIVGTKPYCASGNYINRMSNYCRNCRYKPAKATGEDACPFTVFYWDFLRRHRDAFSGNRRMLFQMKNLERKGEAELEAITKKAKALRREMAPAQA